MAMLISRATGNFTSASTWGVADSATGSQLTAPTTSTNTTTSYVYSSTFTGTNTKVCDGIALYLNRNSSVGTFTVALSENNGTTATRSLTVNASDLPTNPTWVFFKFASTLTLNGGTTYRVGVLGSSANNVSVYRDATAGNWARLISLTDTAAPSAGDTMLVVGELTGAGTNNAFTVTMDNTATTDFGTGVATATVPTATVPQAFTGIVIANIGTMTWGTSAATAYYLKLSGNLVVLSGGTYNMGTSATPCPRDSSMYLQFDCVADGDFGFVALDGSICSFYGQSRSSGKNIVSCKLNTDEAIASTSLGVDTDTGWLDNDVIAVASTTQTVAQSEVGALNGNASSNTLTVDSFGGAGGGLAFAHSGTSPTQAEVILLTRNVRISGTSVTVVSYFVASAYSSFTMYWTEFFWMGTSFSKPMLTFDGTNTTDIQYCAFRDGKYGMVAGGSTVSGNIKVSNNTFYRAPNATGSQSITLQRLLGSGTILIENNVIFYPASTAITAAIASINNNTVVSAGADAITVGTTIPTSFSGNVIHSCSTNGFSSSHTNNAILTISNLTVWRCGQSGISVSGAGGNTQINGLNVFGNNVASFSISGLAYYMTVNNFMSSGDTSFATPIGIRFLSNGVGGSYIALSNGTFGVASGIYVAHSNSDISIGTSVNSTQIYANNVSFASTTEVASPSNLSLSGFVKSSKHDQTEGAFRSWFRNGRIDLDTTIFNTASPSERLTPSSASVKLQSGSRIVAVDDLGTVTINAYVRKSVAGDGAAYNGNQPRLILKANPACGIASDTVLDTMTVAAGSWEQLTGTTSAVDADGALEFVVDCDGTTGWVNVDDWSVS